MGTGTRGWQDMCPDWLKMPGAFRKMFPGHGPGERGQVVVCNGAVGLTQDGHCPSPKRFYLSKAEYSFSPTQKHYVGSIGIFMHFLVKLTHTKIERFCVVLS